MMPKPLDIAVIHRGGMTVDIYVETDEMYDRVIKEAPKFGRMEHFLDFIRLEVAPTFNYEKVVRYIVRD